VPAVLTLGKKSVIYGTGDGAKPSQFLDFFFPIPGLKKKYYLATGCNTNTIKTLFILDILGTIETR
jgi:hypothetical protein